MTNQAETKPQKVEELKHFPFVSFDELKAKVAEGVANIGVDRGVALQWIQKGIYSSTRQRVYGLFLASLIFLVPLGLVVYIIYSQSWWLFLAIPLLIIGFFILHPSSGMMFGPIRTLLILFTFGGLVWGFMGGISWLTAVTICLAILWYSQKAIYGRAVDGMIRAALEHEDLLCILWSGNSLNISLYNGDSYWNRWKTESGESTHYDDTDKN